MEIPTLTTERLSLQPFKQSDAAAMHRILIGEDILKYFPGTHSPTLEGVQRMIERVLAHWEQHQCGLWAVKLDTEADIIGRCGLQTIAETGEIEIDFILDRQFWGLGIATEVGTLSLQYGFNTLENQEIIGLVHPENMASRRVLEKLGMNFDREAEYFGMQCRRYTIAKTSVLPVSGHSS